MHSPGKGLGGSEEAVVYLTQELAVMGYRVEVYGDPPVEDITVGDPHDHHCHCHCQGQGQDRGHGNGNDYCRGDGDGQGQVLWFHHSQVPYNDTYNEMSPHHTL